MGEKQPHPIDENLITIAPGPQANDESAVLTAVKQREIELKTELLKTRQAADDILAKARSEAAAIRSGAAASGQKKAGKIVNKEIANVQEEASRIADATDQNVKDLTAKGRKNFDQAVAFIIQAIMPKSGKEAKNVLENGQS